MSWWSPALMCHVRLHVGVVTGRGRTYCTWVPQEIHASFTVSPNGREWAFCDYQRVCLIWFNPVVRMSLGAAAISGFCFVISEKTAATAINRLCLPGQQVGHARVSDDLRPSVGARRRDNRATHRRGCADFDRCQHCFLWRDDGEHQHSLGRLILFDSFFESGSIKLQRDNIKHFTAVLHGHPEQGDVHSVQSNSPGKKNCIKPLMWPQWHSSSKKNEMHFYV